MPKLTRWLAKTALIYLMAALVLASLLMVQRAHGGGPLGRGVEVGYFHLFFVGWVTQLIFGVAWWMFPPLSERKHRGDETLGWTAYWALNVGLVLRVLVEPLAPGPGSAGAWLLVVSATLQVGAAALFALQLWPRVRGPAGTARRRGASI